MTPDALIYALHTLAALIWVGGMFFAWMILRPAAVSALQGPERLKLWLEVFPRFFYWVWAAVIVLPVSGVGMLHLGFAGFDNAPRYVQVMMGLYLVMTALFIRIQALKFPELRAAVAAASRPSLPGKARYGADWQSHRARSWIPCSSWPPPQPTSAR